MVKRFENASLEIAVDIVGSVAELARAVGVTRPAVYQWRRNVPARRAVQIERLTRGRVRREQLAPDVFA